MESMESSYNLVLVALSYFISVFGAYTALQLAVGIPAAQGKAMWGWLIGAAVAMGGGAIWSMHFIGMLAYEMPMRVYYDTGLTVVSLVVAVLCTGAGLYVVGRGTPRLWKLVLGSVVTGLGVSGMHYTGMAAMQMPADVTYKPSLFYLSIAIAIVASMAALWLAFNLRGNLQRFGSAFVMGAAVCGMHYTGMAAAVVTPNGSTPAVLGTAVRPESLGSYIFGITFVMLTIVLLVAVLRSRSEPAYEL